MWPQGPPESAVDQQGGALLSRESLALILFLVTLSELLLPRRIPLLGYLVNSRKDYSDYNHFYGIHCAASLS